MATIDITVLGNQIRGPSSIYVSPNEVVTFTLGAEFSFASPLTVIYGGTVWTNGGTRTLYANSSVNATTKNTWGNTGYIEISRSGYTPLNIAINNTQPDLNPNPFPFTSTTNQVPSASLISNRVTITGINRRVAVSVVGGAARVGNNAWGDSGNSGIANNQTLEIMADSPANFGQQKSVSVTVGERTEVWLISTKASPSNLIKTSSVRSGFSLRNNVRDFFAGSAISGATTAPNNMSAFVRGGLYIPNIPNNTAIPTSKAGMMLSQFVGAATYLDWTQGGRSQSKVTQSGTTLAIDWSLASTPAGTVALDHPRVGYQKIIGACEIRWQIIRHDQHAAGDVTIPAALGTYSSSNINCRVTAQRGTFVPSLGKTHFGLIRVFVRHKVYTSIILTRDLPYTFRWTPQI